MQELKPETAQSFIGPLTAIAIGLFYIGPKMIRATKEYLAKRKSETAHNVEIPDYRKSPPGRT